LANVSGILERGGLWCDARFRVAASQPTIVTDPGIKEKRAGVRLPPDGTRTLADYVPFFFFPRNPMTYRVQAQHPSLLLIFVVVDAETFHAGDECLMTTMHALGNGSRILPWRGRCPDAFDIGIEGQSWNGNHLLELKLQAEFLIPITVRLKKIVGIAIRREADHAAVTSALAHSPVSIPVRVRRDWFQF
jgi:hypothetical protein